MRLPEILLAVSQRDIAQMQLALSQCGYLRCCPVLQVPAHATPCLWLPCRVWSRFVWAAGPMHRAEIRRVFSLNNASSPGAAGSPAGHPFAALHKFPVRKDAMHTLMQALMARLPHAG